VLGGQAMVGPVDQHRLYQEAGQTWASLFGRQWREVVGGVSRAFSEAVAATLGTYNEVLVAVPDCYFQGDASKQRYDAVLGMLADSGVAIWGDWSMRCGYQKRLGRVSRQADGAIDIAPVAGPSSAIARWEPAPLAAAPVAGLGRWPEWFQQPLLGRLDTDRFAVTFLDRDLTDAQAVTRPSAGRLCHRGPFLPGLRQGDHAIEPLSERHPCGAIQASGLPVMVTYPLHFAGVPTLDEPSYSPGSHAP
jgi:hypothetical protein